MERARYQAYTLAQTMAGFFERYDVLINTNLTCGPKRIEEVDPSPTDIRLTRLLSSPWMRPVLRAPGSVDRVLDTQVESMVSRVPYRTTPANITGEPAMSVPLHWTENDLPIGVQFHGPFGSERMLLRSCSTA